jgi:hypothetical protein
MRQNMAITLLQTPLIVTGSLSTEPRRTFHRAKNLVAAVAGKSIVLERLAVSFGAAITSR